MGARTARAHIMQLVSKHLLRRKSLHKRAPAGTHHAQPFICCYVDTAMPSHRPAFAPSPSTSQHWLTEYSFSGLALRLAVTLA